MRLLNTSTGEFVWVEDPLQERYAALSHVWLRSPAVEQTYHDILRIQEDVRLARITDPTLPADEVLRRASPKISNACRYARFDGLHLIWIDAPCIDKTSSAELSEAINSMYEWYRLSTVCYAFLHDVDADEDLYEGQSSFRSSIWHTRGWTLQELIAPPTVVFLSSDWRMLGGKHRLAGVVQDVTGIDADVLTHSRPLDTISVARRMFWASRRQTTRKEDEAYCLMGIFGVHIPIMYGEGQKAFLRLQEAILKQIPDQSIFVWFRDAIPDDTQGHDSLLATNPTQFSSSGDIKPIPKDVLARRLGISELPPTTYIVTSEGIRVTFPLRPFAPSVDIGVLACENGDGNLLGLVLRQTKLAFVRCVGAPLDNPAFLDQSSQVITHHPSIHVYTIPSLSIDPTIKHRVSEVYIVYRRSLSPPVRPPPITVQSSQPFKMVFSRPRLSKTEEGQFTYAFREPQTLVNAGPAGLNATAQLLPVSPFRHPAGATQDPSPPSYTLRISGTKSGWSFEVEFTPLQCAAHKADRWSSLAARTTFVCHGRVETLSQQTLCKNSDLLPEDSNSEGTPEQTCAHHAHHWEATSGFLRRGHFSYQNVGPELGGLRDGDGDLSIVLSLRLEHPGNHDAAYPAMYSLSAFASGDWYPRSPPASMPLRLQHSLPIARREHARRATFSDFGLGYGPLQPSPIKYGRCNLRDAFDQNFPGSMRADGLVDVYPKRHRSDSGEVRPLVIRLSVMNRAEHAGHIDLRSLMDSAGGQIVEPEGRQGYPTATRGLLATAVAQEVKKLLERERARGNPLRYGEREVRLEDLVLVNVDQPRRGELVPMLALELELDDKRES